jgi:hypothetical protein
MFRLCGSSESPVRVPPSTFVFIQGRTSQQVLNFLVLFTAFISSDSSSESPQIVRAHASRLSISGSIKENLVIGSTWDVAFGDRLLRNALVHNLVLVLPHSRLKMTSMHVQFGRASHPKYERKSEGNSPTRGTLVNHSWCYVPRISWPKPHPLIFVTFPFQVRSSYLESNGKGRRIRTSECSGDRSLNSIVWA